MLVKDILKDIKDVILEDDNNSYGGVEFQGETLSHFLSCILCDRKLGDMTLDELNESLEECGIKKLEVK